MNSTSTSHPVLSAFAPSTIGFALLISLFIVLVWGREVVVALADKGEEGEPGNKRSIDEKPFLPLVSSGDGERHSVPSAAKTRKAIQNAVYRRWGGALVAFGLLGGFGPSITKWIVHSHVWDVGTDEPHAGVDGWLYAHIAGAILWGVSVCHQLISGGSSQATVQKMHRIIGWVGVVGLSLGIVLCGSGVWTIYYDFVNAPTLSIGAGVYTLILGAAAMFNISLSVWHARHREFALHKDYVLMAIMWTMDPAVHRTFMWIMHLACYSCFSPAAFAGRPDTLNVIAKMAANVVLFTWVFAMSVHARRLNKILVVNGSLQYLLWIGNIVNDTMKTMGLGVALGLGLGLAFAYVVGFMFCRRFVKMS